LPTVSVYIRSKNYEKLRKISSKTGKSVGYLVNLLIEHGSNELLRICSAYLKKHVQNIKKGEFAGDISTWARFKPHPLYHQKHKMCDITGGSIKLLGRLA